jgi:hypothetical protein
MFDTEPTELLKWDFIKRNLHDFETGARSDKET